MRGRGRRFLVVGLVVVLVATASLAWRVGGVATDLREAERLVDEASVALADGRIGDASDALASAEDLLVDVNTRMHTAPEVSLVGWMPGIAPNLSVIRRSLGSLTALAHAGSEILESSEGLEGPDGTLEVSLSDGSVPVRQLTIALDRLEILGLELATADLTVPDTLIAPPVRELGERVQETVLERRLQVQTLRRGLALLSEVAGANGPRRYLIAVANTAEMRGSGGMILNYGVLEGSQGQIELTEFGRIDELALDAPVSADGVPTDYLARWSGFEPLRRWRQANLAADFTVVAPVLEAMYEQATRLAVDGVIQVDPGGLSAILDGVGPVQVAGLGEVDGDNVEALVLHEAYIRFPGVEERSDVLGDVAEASFRRLVEGDVPSLRTLARRLVEAVDGHHVVMHARGPSLQQDIEAFAATGELPPLDGPPSVAMTAQNLSGNKLDWFLDTGLAITGSSPEAQVGRWRATVTVSNTAVPGVSSPRYVYGPGSNRTSTPAGTLRTLATVYLPAGTSVTGSSGDETVEPVSSGVEGGRPYASFIVDVPAGEVREVTIDLQVAPRPAGAYELLLSPSPRVRPTQVSVDLDLGGSTLAADLVLDRTWSLSDVREPQPVVGQVFER